jgi:hypothetical protein
VKRPSTGRKKPRPVMGISNINFTKKEVKTPREGENNIENEIVEEKKTPNKRDAPSPLKV